MEKTSLGNECRYSLTRDRDGKGDSGMMFRSINPETGEQEGEAGDIIVGCCIQCGTPFARTFGQDWWLTTPVTEILSCEEEGESKVVKFKTRNSNYTAKTF